MRIIFGLLLSFLSLFLAAQFLEQSLAYFFDNVAVVVVFGGTVAVAIMTAPSLKFRVTLSYLFDAFKSNGGLRKSAIQNAVFLVRDLRSPKNLNRIDEIVLAEGLELHRLGFSNENIQKILNDKVEHYIQSGHSVYVWLKSVSKYPPAFGLAGTVLGLIHLMRSLSQSSNPTQTGLLMSVALLATFYGIIVSNLFFAPIAERIKMNLDEYLSLSEISLKGIELLCERSNLLETQEVLNSHIVKGESKLNLIGQLGDVA